MWAWSYLWYYINKNKINISNTNSTEVTNLWVSNLYHLWWWHQIFIYFPFQFSTTIFINSKYSFKKFRFLIRLFSTFSLFLPPLYLLVKIQLIPFPLLRSSRWLYVFTSDLHQFDDWPYFSPVFGWPIRDVLLPLSSSIIQTWLCYLSARFSNRLVVVVIFIISVVIIGEQFYYRHFFM